jgi:hypothetical protein
MKVVLITGAAPPSVGSHATRIAAFVQALVEADITVSIVTCEWPADLRRSSTLYSKISSICQIVEVPGGMLRNVASTAWRSEQGSGAGQRIIPSIRRIGKKFAIPDTFATWIPGATKAVVELAKDDSKVVLLSSGAPFSAHVVGSIACARTGRPLILDYGDPWVYEPGYPRSGIRLRVERAMETWALKKASAVIVTTQATRDLYRQRFKALPPTRCVLPMGFDPSDFQGSGPSVSEIPPWTFCYMGRVNNEYRSLSLLRNILVSATSRGMTKDQIRFVFYGPDRSRIEQELSDFMKSGMVEAFGGLDHEAFVTRLRASHALLVFGNNNYVQVPGKVAQCVAARRPILYLPNVPDLSRDPSIELINRCVKRGAFIYTQPSDFDAICQFIESGDGVELDQTEFDALSWRSIGQGLTTAVKAIGLSNISPL